MKVRRDDVGLLWIACFHCGGDPIHGKGGLGYVFVDGYTGREITSAETYAAPAPVRYRRVSCMDCAGWGALPNGRRCKTCEGVGAYNVLRFQPTREERERESRPSDALLLAASSTGATVAAGLWDRGSFGAVCIGLNELTPWNRRLVWRAYVSGSQPPASLSGTQAENLSCSVIGVTQTARRIDGRIRVPAELRAWAEDARVARVNGTGRHANSHARGQRNTEIRKLAEEGWSRRRIAARFGLAKASVDAILKPKLLAE